MTAPPPQESIILCEGFHDRSFWKGMLDRLGCKEQRVDPFGKPVKGDGQHGFEAPSGRFIRVVPCKGDGKVLDAIGPHLKGRTTQALAWLIVNVDSDAAANDAGPGRASRVQAVESRFLTGGALTKRSPTHYTLTDETNLGLALWETPDQADAALPDKQTLERLVCAAMLEAFPNRAKAVATWLGQRPEPESSGCKELHEKAFAWSHMAGWYGHRGCDEFYQGVWADDAVAKGLEGRLRANGVWSLVEALLA